MKEYNSIGRLSRIVVFDMKGLRDFADAHCISLSAFIETGGAPDWASVERSIVADQPAIIRFPRGEGSMGRTLSHGDLMHMIGMVIRLAQQHRDRVAGGDVHADVAQHQWVGLCALDLQQDAERAVVMAVLADQAGQPGEAAGADGGEVGGHHTQDQEGHEHCAGHLTQRCLIRL